jgi:hypothetical protein
MAHATPVASDIVDLERGECEGRTVTTSSHNPKITLELYAQAVSADQQEAHKKVVQMAFPSEFQRKLKARSVPATA